jgi:hypothetical protein
MDIKTVEHHVAALQAANKFGVLGVYHDRNIQVQVDSALFAELLKQERAKVKVTTFPSEEYPFSVVISLNQNLYFSLFTKQEFGTYLKLGGRVDEFTTEN